MMKMRTNNISFTCIVAHLVFTYHSFTFLYINFMFSLVHLFINLAVFFNFIMAHLDFSFKHPTTIQVSGPTGCGKTRLVLRILQHRLIQPFPRRIIWVYGEDQPDYREAKSDFPHIEFIKGWQDGLYESISPDETNLLIIDDQMNKASSSSSLTSLVTVGSHHKNLTIIYLIQNLFNKGSSQRTVSLNCHYDVVFKNSRDITQFRVMARQMQAQNSKWLISSFEDATSQPYGYLVLDHHTKTPEDRRYVTCILPGERLTVYNPRKNV